MGLLAELIPFAPQMIRLQPDNFVIWPLPIPITRNSCGVLIPIGPARSKLRHQVTRQRKSPVARGESTRPRERVMPEWPESYLVQRFRPRRRNDGGHACPLIVGKPSIVRGAASVRHQLHAGGGTGLLPEAICE